MGLSSILTSHLLVNLLYLSVCWASRDDTLSKRILESGQCTLEDLNHSALVECNDLDGCNDSNKNERPLEPNEVLHIFSTRSGARLNQKRLQRWHYQESEEQRMFDINTTLYIDSKTNTNHVITGFGSTIDLTELLDSDRAGDFDGVYGPILENMLTTSNGGLGLSLLRLIVSRNLISDPKLPSLFEKLSEYVTRLRVNDTKPIDFILEFEGPLQELDPGRMKKFADTFLGQFVLNCIAIAIDSDDFKEENFAAIASLKAYFERPKLLSIVKLSSSVSLIDRLMAGNWAFDGVLVDSEVSTPYTTLDYLRSRYSGIKIFVKSREKLKTAMYGDWVTAQNFGVELLNHFKHGAMGFVDSQNIFVDILGDSKPVDCAIYSLRKGYNIHFRGPIYYAIGHFSRYVTSGSARLKTELFTQPNMFAAHYIAFLTRDGQVVVVVLNDNEHMLPFRMSIDGYIEANTMLEPKSFNTLLIQV